MVCKGLLPVVLILPAASGTELYSCGNSTPIRGSDPTVRSDTPTGHNSESVSRTCHVAAAAESKTSPHRYRADPPAFPPACWPPGRSSSVRARTWSDETPEPAETFTRLSNKINRINVYLLSN